MIRQSTSPSIPFAVVVNDDPTQLLVLAGLIRKAGLEPRAFTGAEAALATMTSGTLPAIVITDLYMPGIDGWRFCRLLRSPEYTAFNTVPILVVSATFAGNEPDRIARDLGAEAFLSTPIDGTLFVERVRAILTDKRARTPLRLLIVEDSKSLCGMLKKVFDANGYHTDTAFTVRQASAAFKNAAYDVAVLDYHLPDGRGDSLLDAFHAARPSCVCLMMTTDPGPELALSWMKRGAAAYLLKPFAPEYLLELCIRTRRERCILQVQDLLEMRTSELRESEKRLRRAETIAGFGNWEIDLTTKTVSASEGARIIYGVSGSSLTLESIQRIPLPEYRTMLDGALHGLVAGGKQYDVEFKIRRESDGAIIDIHSVATYDRDHSRVFGVMHDITARKQAEELVKQRSDELQTRNEEQERFLYTASHDLRTPVVTIKSFARFLEQDIAAADTVKIDKSLNFIKNAADKMEHLLNDMLEMSRIGRIVHPSVHVTAKSLVNEALEVVTGRITERHVTIKVMDMDVVLYCDRTRLAELWQNLLENACKFMGDQAEPCIEIGVERGTSSEEDSSFHSPQSTVFYVRDNGIGIDPEFHYSVFGLFNKLDKHTEGTGVGLAIVKRIVDLHYGRIWIKSEGSGRGTCFYFTLPGAVEEPVYGEKA